VASDPAVSPMMPRPAMMPNTPAPEAQPGSGGGPPGADTTMVVGGGRKHSPAPEHVSPDAHGGLQAETHCA
jgi:hypothetical protein